VSLKPLAARASIMTHPQTLAIIVHPTVLHAVAHLNAISVAITIH
jgi:hypothetical protein